MTDGSSISSDFPFESKYVDVKGSQLHYVEEGSGPPILFLHGNPTSSYLWRNIIPYVTGEGRAIALDLIGFGKSDKPDLPYRFADHVEYVEGFIAALDLHDITLVIHDWGSGLGLHYAARHEDNVKGLAMMEALMMPWQSYEALGEQFEQVFRMMRDPEQGWVAIVDDNMFVEQLLPGAVARGLTEEEMQHYREPFLDPASRKPIRQWPLEVPIAGEPADVTAVVEAYGEWLQRTEIPKLLFYATPGVIVTAPVVEWARQNLKNLQTVDVGAGIHYLQEDHPHMIGEHLAQWYRDVQAAVG